ncbi:MAG: gluconate 2-dehydrogenase subunit 3 family protein [Sphingomonadales bacterium]|nr:gluconate 2-dehydrogenase subunit 3 family protein [Sphingomonadales bacterium]
MDRRDFLKEAILLVGGAAALTALPGCSWQDAPYSMAADVKKRLERIGEIMIPRTKTFGASDVDAAGFVEKLIANWASKETRGKLLSLIGNPHLVALEKMDDAKATAALSEFDAAAYGKDNKDWKMLKELMMLGYFGSERYQTEIAKFELVPGRYDPCVKLEEEAA